MKKVLGVLSSVIIGVILAVFFLNSGENSKLPEVVVQSSQAEGVENPTLLEIPILGVRASIEHVGVDVSGKMDVPKRAENVAWYAKGYKIGQNGNAVIAGHLDTVTGSPAVFYGLENLSIGDEITVQGDGKTLTFKITGKQVYPSENFPLEEVFGDSSKSRLNLITCQGVFDSAARNYSHRTVIFSELVKL